jgi:tRNA threonylcarbamoyladenosine biosynthesis protein TsaE
VSADAPALVDHPPWSVEVLDPPAGDAWRAPVEREAVRRGALDLRSRRPLPGWRQLADGVAEHVRPVQVRLADAEATRALGRRVGAVLRAGDLLVLSGPLGAGKTTFTQGLGEALGVRGRVTSPTFVLARVHPGPLPLVHVDAYRLRPVVDAGGRLDLDDLDLDAALEDSVTVVEWGEGVVDRLTDVRLDVRLDRPQAGTTDDRTPDGTDDRTAEIHASGARWAVLHP